MASALCGPQRSSLRLRRGSGEYSDPRRHHGRQIGCDGIARVIVKRDVKADSVTPASLK